MISPFDLNFSPQLLYPGKHDSITVITERIIEEVYLDFSLNKSPFVDYSPYEKQINKMLTKEKDLAATCVKCLVNSFSTFIKSKISKLANFEKYKNQRKDSDGNYVFQINDYGIVIDIHCVYDVIVRLIRQIKSIFEKPISLFNKICRFDYDFEIIFKEIFFNIVFYKEIACLLTYAEYKTSVPEYIWQIVKRFSDEISKLLLLNQFDRLKSALNIDKEEYCFISLISKIRNLIEKSEKNKIEDLKISVCDEDSVKVVIKNIESRQKK